MFGEKDECKLCPSLFVWYHDQDTQGIPGHGRVRKPWGTFVVDSWCIQNGFLAHWPLMITDSYCGCQREMVLWDVVSYLWIKSSKWVDSVGLRRAQARMFFRRPVFKHRRNCRFAASTLGCTLSHFQLQSIVWCLSRSSTRIKTEKIYICCK